MCSAVVFVAKFKISARKRCHARVRVVSIANMVGDNGITRSRKSDWEQNSSIFIGFACDDNSPLHYMPTAIQRAVSFALQPDAVTAVNELRVTACNDNGFCQYDEPSRSTYVATTAKQRAGNVRGNDVA